MSDQKNNTPPSDRAVLAYSKSEQKWLPLTRALSGNADGGMVGADTALWFLELDDGSVTMIFEDHDIAMWLDPDTGESSINPAGVSKVPPLVGKN